MQIKGMPECEKRLKRGPDDTCRERYLVTWNRGPEGNPATENLRVVSFPLQEVLKGSECTEGEYRFQSEERGSGLRLDRGPKECSCQQKQNR